MTRLPKLGAAQSCLDFVNTEWTDHRGSGHRHDELMDPQRRARVLAGMGHHLEPEPDAQALLVMRQARTELRGLLETWASGGALPALQLNRLKEAVPAVPGRLQLELAGNLPRVGFVPARRDGAWLVIEMVASATQLMEGGEARRLKTCANPGCTWLFYDSSHNVSRRWCDPASCGNLVTVRAHRARAAGPTL